MESVAESVKVTVEEFVYEAPLLMLTEPDGTVVSDGVASLNVAIIAPPGFPGWRLTVILNAVPGAIVP